MAKELLIEKYQDISLEITDADYEKLLLLEKESNQSVNELINRFIEFGLNSCVIK